MKKLLSKTLINLIVLYRVLLSSWLPPRCRFIPTCSMYAIEAIEKHGILQGLWLSMRRILRCHPWGKYGYDPVPESLMQHQKGPR
ncbi:MAG: membrane protein insertion efficiency factor YidD [Bacillota bacterium]